MVYVAYTDTIKPHGDFGKANSAPAEPQYWHRTAQEAERGIQRDEHSSEPTRGSGSAGLSLAPCQGDPGFFCYWMGDLPPGSRFQVSDSPDGSL